MNPRPLEPHTLDEHRRIEAYRIRLDTTAPLRIHTPLRTGIDRLSLRGPGGRIDTTLVAIESTHRRRAGLPAYIAELDMPPAHRNPAPWRYCHHTGCPLCPIAYRCDLPDSTPFTTATRWITRTTTRALNALAAALNRIDSPWRTR